MVVQARLRLRHDGCFTQTLRGAAQGAQLGSDRDSDVFVLHGADPAHLERLVAQVSTTRSPCEVLSRTPTSVALRVRAAPHSVPADIAAGGCTVLWPSLFVDGEESYTLLAPSRERLDALVARLRAQHQTVLLESVEEVAPSTVNVNVPLADITTALTERQLIVLQKAIADGYYDSPRRTSTEALAAIFGVTRSTLEEHLRKAERRVLEGFAGVLVAQPVLAHAAARRPGRPPAKTLRHA